jgi:RND family efflux transporter MFP subunit
VFAVSIAEVSQPRDSLSKLRIDRSRPPRSGRWLRRIVWLLVIGGGATGAGKWSWDRYGTELLFRPEVKAGVVERQTGAAADSVLTATGYLKSRRQSKIGARAAGRIQAIEVEEGDPVKANAILAVLEHADIDASLAAMKASAERSKAELREMELQLEKDRRDLERTRSLYNRRSASVAELEDAESLYVNRAARVESMRAGLRERQAMVQQVEQQLENMIVRAPFDGTVISRDAELGESILPGGMGEASGRGSVVTLADLAHLEVDTDVKEDFISRIEDGQPAEVVVDAVPDRRYRGRLRKIIPMGDRARATIKVKVEILDADKRLFPDMSATVYFMPQGKPAAAPAAKPKVVMSASALRNDAQGTFVWQLGAKDTVRRVTVLTETPRDGRVVVTSGLEGGERVVLDAPSTVQEGMAVKVVQ